MKKFLFTLFIAFGLTTVASAQVKKTTTTTEIEVPKPTPSVIVVKPAQPRTVLVTKTKVVRHRPRHRRVVKRTVVVPAVETRVETTN